jgi:hypothetical protein
LSVEEGALRGTAAVSVEEDVAGILEEDSSVKVCRMLALIKERREEGRRGDERDNIPEKQIIFLFWSAISLF